MAITEVDLQALHTALDQQRNAQGMSWRQVAESTGMSASTFSRIRTGSGPDLNGYVASCRWLGVSLDTFVPDYKPDDPERGTLTGQLIPLFSRFTVPRAYWAALLELIAELARSAQKEGPSTPRRDDGPSDQTGA
jgi:transcriptional regulator with XRE-family HTH domain